MAYLLREINEKLGYIQISSLSAQTTKKVTNTVNPFLDGPKLSLPYHDNIKC